jgi:hypothetical protein
MKEIKIGRDGQTGKLRLTVGGQTATFGQENSVPRSVSQEHALLTIGDDGSLVLTNLNIENDTYVNHRAIERKRISEGDRIILGGEHYRLGWDILKPFIPKMADITSLEQIWRDYQEQRLKMQIRERRFNTLRSATGIITTLAVVLGAVTGRDNPLFMALYIAAGVISLVFFIIAFRASSQIPLKQNQLTEDTKYRYKCPACGSLLTLQDYDMLRQTKGCPHCGAIWKK